jgi:carboxypeptidase C (cathepsin A)
MFWYLLISAQIAFSMPASHLVTNLPGVPSYSFQIYSGYLQIPNSGGKELHYMFYTSQNSPANDPVVLWLNGGPGCSSMEGAFMENGPFIFSETNNTMFTNPYSWNRIANMLYLEAPAGVGYSMMGNINNNSTNDTQTAADNLQALLAWYALFPEFVKNSFYIAGESYSGVYVPYLATYVLQYNSQSPSSLIPIKGILVGNPVTDWNVDADSAWPAFLYWHQIIDDSIYVPWVNLNCSLLWTSSPSCDPLAQSMYDLFTGINYYDIYRECIPVQPMYENHKRRWMTENLQGIDNCVPDNALILYMNNPKVRNALHINTTLGAWSECADLNYFMNMSGSYFLYPNLINTPNFIINIYSGDTDSSVPTEGTRAWINNLGLTTNVAWAEWYLNKQVAGMYTRYGTNFRFNTIRGAGHMCIQWLPAQGFTMFQSFLMGVDLPLSP